MRGGGGGVWMLRGWEMGLDWWSLLILGAGRAGTSGDSFFAAGGGSVWAFMGMEIARDEVVRWCFGEDCLRREA